MLNVPTIFALLFFGLANFASAEFADISPLQLQKFLDSHQKVVVLFDSSDPKCTACEPANGGPFEALSNDYDCSSIQFVRVRWPSPWWRFPQTLNSLFQQAKIMGVPAVVGIERAHPVFVVPGRMENTEAVRQSISSTLSAAASSDQK